MGKFDGVLLASDFDGTLYGTGGAIPEANLRALDYFVSEGGRFTVATGRTPVTFGRYVAPARVNAPAVLFNGAALYDFSTGTALLRTDLCTDAPADLAALCRDFPELGFEACQWEDTYVFRPNWVTEYHRRNMMGRDARPVSEISQIPLPWTKVIVEQDHDMLLQARRWLTERCSRRYEIIFSNPVYLELIARGSTKGSMVARLAERLGIRREHVYCVGDSENDLSMLSISAVPFAPSNCTEEVRQAGAQVLGSCDEGVVAAVIAQLDTRY